MSASESASICFSFLNRFVCEIPLEVHGKEYEIHCDSDISFYADYAWTLEAVQNVIKNGIEHTPDGGKIFKPYLKLSSAILCVLCRNHCIFSGKNHPGKRKPDTD